MIRDWPNARRSNRQSRRRHKFQEPGSFEKLEDRLCLSFGSAFDGTTLTLNQTADDGNVLVFKNDLNGNAFSTLDGAGLVVFVPATNLIVNLLDGTTNQLNLDLDAAHAGNVTLNVGDGDRDVFLQGDTTEIGGDLVIVAGTGVQMVSTFGSSPGVLGNLNVDLGGGDDEFRGPSGTFSVSGNFSTTHVNRVSFTSINSILIVGGNLVMDTTGENISSNLGIGQNALSTIGGDLIYTGGSEVDNLFLNNVAITGNVIADQGDGITAGSVDQNFSLGAASSIGGTATITAGEATNGNSIEFFLDSLTSGNIAVDVEGGLNEAMFRGTFNGNQVTYDGGSGSDSVLYDFTGNPADVAILLGAGDDAFDLGSNASISPTTLFVDFGNDNDSWNNQYGDWTFDTLMLGLQGFDIIYGVTTQTLTINEILSDGPVLIDNGGPGREFRINATILLTPADNLNVSMADNSGNDLMIELNDSLTGNMMVDLGDGDRRLEFDTGQFDRILGDLTVTAGSGTQVIGPEGELHVDSNTIIDLGVGSDALFNEEFTPMALQGDLTLIGVNRVSNAGILQVGGNLLFDVSGELTMSKFRAADAPFNSRMELAGDFTYIGSNHTDEIGLSGSLATNTISTIGGNVSISMFDDVADGLRQYVSFSRNHTLGHVTIRSGVGSGDGAGFLSDPLTTNIGGDILLEYGPGSNDIDIRGTFGGSNIKYNGSGGSDDVEFNMSGNPAFVNIKLSTGDDQFTLNAAFPPAIDVLRVDFGGGNDTFENNLGNFTFDARFLRWAGFNRFYTQAIDEWAMLQLEDTGDVTLDNNGAGGAIRLIDGAITEMTSSANVRLNLLSGSSSDVVVDLDAAHSGDLLLQLRDGDRNVIFFGDNNTVGGRLRIEAAAGVQNLYAAVNADLQVGGNFIYNGRDASDTLADGGNNILVSGSMFLRNINDYHVSGILSVGDNFNMVSVQETEDTVLSNSGTLTVGGNLTYIGGGGVDDLLLNMGGTSIAGDVNITLGDGDGADQTVILRDGFVANQLVIIGGNSTGGHHIAIDEATEIATDVLINLSANTTVNAVLMLGTYGGTYGTFRGGSGTDYLVFGASAPNMAFAGLLSDEVDSFTLEPTASLSSLFVDFGTGNDFFIDNLGQPWPFPVTLVNLP